MATPYRMGQVLHRPGSLGLNEPRDHSNALNAMAENFIILFKAEVINFLDPWKLVIQA